MTKPISKTPDRKELPGYWAKYAETAAEVAEATNPPSHRAFLEYTPVPALPGACVWEYPNNDDGRAAFFLANYGEIVRWVPELRIWRVWHGHRWHDDRTGRVGAYCQILSRAQIIAAGKLLQDLTETQSAQTKARAEGETTAAEKLSPRRVATDYVNARKAAEALGNEKVIATLLAAAARQGNIVVPALQWDADPMLAGTQNGVLDLKTQKHREGMPGDYITKSLAVTYDADAKCPEFEKFIIRILPAVELRRYIQSLLGYSLTGLTNDQGFYFCFGLGANGKSSLIKTAAGIMGDYAAKGSGTLIEQPLHGGECKAEVAQLPGVRFLYCEETSTGGHCVRLRESLLKSATDGGVLNGEEKYCAPITFKPVFKLWVSGNHRPMVSGTDDGMWRRVRLLPFSTTIPEDERTPESELMATMTAERAGILNWMLTGLAACPNGVVRMPVIVRTAVAEYRRSEDMLADFIEECIQDAPGGYEESKGAVYDAYTRWAQRNGIKFTLTQRQFTGRLGDREGWRLNGSKTKWMQKSVRTDDTN